MYARSIMNQMVKDICRIAEQSVNPPEVSPEEYERNLRNSIRGDVFEYAGKLADRLDELDRTRWQETIRYLDGLRGTMELEMED